MKRIKPIIMYSGTHVEGSETEMGEELSKEITDLQSDRPTQGLGCDRPRSSTLVTRVSPINYPIQRSDRQR